jgi:hypothetical protein
MAVNKLFPKEQNFKRITISNEEIQEPYKIEDIHSSRQNDFDKEFEKKRIELENYMTPQKPLELDFSDNININNEKIKAMDILIAEKMAQRNLDLNLLVPNNNQNNQNNVENWLNPIETSIKIEKHDSLKKVSWAKEEINNTNNNTNNNIFDRLKKIPITSDTNNSILEENEYVQQKSMSLPLPEVNQELLTGRDKLINPVIFSGEPVIPKSEIVKQLNEMNNKIDKLFEVVSKLTNELIKNKNIDLDLDLD